MRKLLSIFCLSIFMMSMTSNKSIAKEVIQKKDCIDEAREIAFYYMENYGYSEDQGAELVLLLIQGC